MEYINDLLIPTLFFIGGVAILLLLYRYAFKYLKKKVSKTESPIDDFIVEIFRFPSIWLMFWIAFKIFSSAYLTEAKFYDFIDHINTILLILSVGWILIKLTKALSYFFQKRLDINNTDNLKARKSLTQVKVFEHIIDTVIVIVTISISLLTFEEARNIGVSILTSAGILGIIVGLAAQKSIGMILAGIQIAITQPVRLDDVVVIEGEWGRIEEITLTYVVVKIWDERRLVLPITYLMEKPFQNWTRKNANILGTIFLYLDYAVPVDALRKQLTSIVENHDKWDKRVAIIQVTDTSERYMELRLLLSSSDSPSNWDLRVDVREKMIDFINKNILKALLKFAFRIVSVVLRSNELRYGVFLRKFRCSINNCQMRICLWEIP